MSENAKLARREKALLANHYGRYRLMLSWAREYRNLYVSRPELRRDWKNEFIWSLWQLRRAIRHAKLVEVGRWSEIVQGRILFLAFKFQLPVAAIGRKHRATQQGNRGRRTDKHSQTKAKWLASAQAHLKETSKLG